MEFYKYSCVKNMKKLVLIGFMCTLLLASTIAPIQAYDSVDKGTATTQTYTYDGAEVGSEYIFYTHLEVSAEFENAAVYDVINDWAAANPSSPDYTELVDMAGMDEDYFAPINQDFQIKLELTHQYSEWQEASWTAGNSYRDEYDVFNASMLAREGEEGDWVTPTASNMENLAEIAEFTFNSLAIVNDSYYHSGVNNGTEILEEVGLFENDEIQRILTKNEWSYNNGTVYDPTVHFPSYDAAEPQRPFDVFEFQRPVFFKPSGFDFKEWEGWAEDVTNDNGGTTAYADYATAAGITQLRTNTNSIGAVYATEAVNHAFFEDMTGFNFGTEVPMSDFEAQVHYALEYDEDGIFADCVTYYEFSGVVDTTGLVDAPVITEELFTISVIASIYGEDYSMAEKDQIVDGKIGDLRNLTGFNCPFLNALPGYPVWIVSALALVSVTGLILKVKSKSRRTN